MHEEFTPFSCEQATGEKCDGEITDPYWRMKVEEQGRIQLNDLSAHMESGSQRSQDADAALRDMLGIDDSMGPEFVEREMRYWARSVLPSRPAHLYDAWVLEFEAASDE